MPDPVPEPNGNMRSAQVTVVRSRPETQSLLLKYSSLVVLVVQNASQVLLIRYARTREKKDMFLATSAVFWTEVLKLFTCICIVTIHEKSFVRCVTQIQDHIIRQPLDTAKVCIPSVIYTVQNNLLYVAVSHLAAATFMVTYQLKILTTALFAVLMLRKPLSRIQWFSLVLLFTGISIVQLNEQSQNTANPKSTNSAQNPALGFACVILACVLSGFSGIYFEKILKGSDITVWMRNIQLAVLAVPVSYLTMQAKDGSVVSREGLFYGYDWVVWLIICVYALGGLTVAVVIRYADNILKGFATSVSIVLSCILSAYLFNFWPTPQFILGTGAVMLSIYLYSKYPHIAKDNNIVIPEKTVGKNGTSNGNI